MTWLPLTVFYSFSVAAMAIALWSTDHLIEDAGRDTDAWNTAEIVTEKESPTEWLKATTNATFLQTCTTTDEAERGIASGKNRTVGKAAGVSTKEGGVEQGPIAHPPRWVQPDLRLCLNSLSFPLLSPFYSALSPSFSNHFFLQLLASVSSTIFMICFCSVRIFFVFG